MSENLTSTKPGKLIVFEGIDGAGKSTQCQQLKAFLETQGIEVLLSYEPTNGPIGKKIRALASEGVRLPADDELELFIQDRKNHVNDFISPALARGQWVILDRYYFSTMAYQSLNGFDIKTLRDLNEAFAPVPDLLILLNLSVETSLERINARNEGVTAFEKTETLAHCASVFDSLATEPFACQISAEQKVSAIAQQIKEEVTTRLLA